MTDGYVIMSITFALSHSMEALILPAAQRWLLKLIAEFSPICCLPLKKAPLATVAHPPCRQTASITDWNGGAKALTPQLSWYSKESFQLLNHLRPLLQCLLVPTPAFSDPIGIDSEHSQWTFCLQILVSFPRDPELPIRHVV